MRWILPAVLLLAPASAARAEKPKTIVYAGSTGGWIYALDGRDGREIWNVRLHAKVLASPVLDSGRLYAATSDANSTTDEGKRKEGRVLALDPATGAVIWNVRVGAAIDHAPVVAGGRILAVSDDGAVSGLDPATGAVRWRRQLGSPPAGDPVVSGSAVVFTTRDGSLRALDPASGESIWQARNDDLVPGTPRVVGDLVCVGFRSRGGSGSPDRGFLAAYAARTGELRWRSRGVGQISARPTSGGKAVYALSHDDHAYAISAGTGRVIWKRRLGPEDLRYSSALVCSPLSVGDVVYVLAHGRLHALGAGTGEALWHSKLEGRSIGLAASDDLLVVGGYCPGPARKPGGTGSVTGVDPLTGAVKWSVEKDYGGFYGVPVILRRD